MTRVVGEYDELELEAGHTSGVEVLFAQSVGGASDGDFAAHPKEPDRRELAKLPVHHEQRVHTPPIPCERYSLQLFLD